MNKAIYFVLMVFALLLVFLIGCKKDLTGINALADYKVAAILDGVGDLSLITPNGTDRTIIEEGPVNQIEWSPVDAKLLYTIQSPNIWYETNLYLLDLQTNERNLLVTGKGATQQRPIFSNDGQKIVYTTLDTTNNLYEMVLINSNGDGKKIIYRTPYTSGGEFLTHVGWSNIPDHILVFKGYRTSINGKLYLMNVSDSTFEYVIDFKNIELSSVDGNKWVYNTGYPGDKAIYILDVSQKTTKAVYRNDPGGFDGVSWHPDGSKIVFGMRDSLTASTELYQIDIDGTNLTRLTYIEDEHCYNPDFFPDGKRILYEGRSISGIKRDLYILNISTNETKDITQGSLTMSQGWYHAAISSTSF